MIKLIESFIRMNRAMYRVSWQIFWIKSDMENVFNVYVGKYKIRVRVFLDPLNFYYEIK